MSAWTADVGDRHAFGASLRRARLRAGVTLEGIAEATNVSVTIWESLEDGELYKWPNGVFARAMMSEYARLVGLDPADTLNQFCRLFPQGDRRRSQVVGELATFINQPVAPLDEVPSSLERRAAGRVAHRQRDAAIRRRRIELILTAGTVLIVAIVASLFGRVPFVVCLLVAALSGFAVSGLLGRSIQRLTAGRRARQARVSAWWKRFGRGIGAHP